MPETSTSWNQPRHVRSPWRLQTTSEIAYFVCAFLLPAALCAQAIRNHWAIENRLHYVRDMGFREDDSRIRCKPGIFAVACIADVFDLVEAQDVGGKGSQAVRMQRTVRPSVRLALGFARGLTIALVPRRRRRARIVRRLRRKVELFAQRRVLRLSVAFSRSNAPKRASNCTINASFSY